MTKKAELVLEKYKANLVVVSLANIDICEQKITTYAKYQDNNIAFLPLTLFDINSYRRIQNLLLRFIARIDNNHCPYCGTAFRNSSNRHKCESCGLVTTTTQCEVNNSHKFTYLSYELKSEKIEQMENVDYEQFYLVDSLFHYKDIVGMKVEHGSIRPVCPYCHINIHQEFDR